MNNSRKFKIGKRKFNFFNRETENAKIIQNKSFDIATALKER